MKTKIYLNHLVNGYFHTFSFVPDGPAPEQATVELPEGVKEIELAHGGTGFEFAGDITDMVHTSRRVGNAYPYLMFWVNGQVIRKNLKVLKVE